MYIASNERLEVAAKLKKQSQTHLPQQSLKLLPLAGVYLLVGHKLKWSAQQRGIRTEVSVKLLRGLWSGVRLSS